MKMQEDQMRTEFEKWAVEERGYSIERFEESPHQYVENNTHIAWTAWKASRHNLVITLPVDYNNWGDGYYQQAIDEVKVELEQQGVKWK